MRFSPTGFTATFTRTHASDPTKTFHEHQLVQAWHPETGEPMVLHRNKLVAAPTLAGYVGVDQDEAPKLASSFASPGWTLHGRETETGQSWSRPIVGFAVDTDGYGYPMTVDTEALLSVEEPGAPPGTEREIVAPGERPSWETPA